MLIPLGQAGLLLAQPGVFYVELSCFFKICFQEDFDTEVFA